MCICLFCIITIVCMCVLKVRFAQFKNSSYPPPGHRIPRRRRPANRRVPQHSGLPVPAAEVQRRPAEDHPARPHVHERGWRLSCRHDDVAVQLQVQSHVGQLFTPDAFQKSFGFFLPCSNKFPFVLSNFFAPCREDMYSQDSIDLLQNSGLQFKKHEEEGIDTLYFAELLMTSGLVLCENVKWLSFHRSVAVAVVLSHQCLHRHRTTRSLARL